jgi:hypothetical protein
MSNKPILPNAYVDINNRNLGLTPGQPAGIFAFIGIAQEGTASFDAIVSLGKNDVATLIGYGPLADELIDFFDNGGRKALAVPLDITTESTGTGAMTPTRVGTSTGTIDADKVSGKKIVNNFDLKIEITKAGTVNVGKFKYSLDAGTTWSPEIIIPSGGTYEITGTNIELTFTPGAGPDYYDDGDTFASTITLPLAAAADVTDAVDTLIASDEAFSAITVVEAVSAATGAAIAGKMENAEDSPDFRYAYAMIHGALSDATQSDLVSSYQTIRASVESDRCQVVAAEATMARPNHGSARIDKTVIGAIAGRRSSLNLQNDLGRFDAGALVNVVSLRSATTETMIEDLDGIQCVTIRKFKGVAGYRPTNGWLSDPFSDIKKDAWRLVLDKASELSRVTALGQLKIEVDPSDVSGSTENLKNLIQNALDTQIVGNEEAVSFTVDIPDDQDVLVTEEIKVEIEALVYGHASFIGITIQITNPAAAA